MERDAGSIIISKEKAVIPLMQTVFLSKDVMGVRAVDAVKARAFLESTVRHVDSVWLNGYYEIGLEYYGLEGKRLYKHTIELPLKVELPKWWKDGKKENIELTIIEPTIEVLSPYVLEFSGKIVATSKTKDVMDVAPKGEKTPKRANKTVANEAMPVKQPEATPAVQRTSRERELSQDFPLPELSEIRLEMRNEIYLESPGVLIQEQRDIGAEFLERIPEAAGANVELDTNQYYMPVTENVAPAKAVAATPQTKVQTAAPPQNVELTASAELDTQDYQAELAQPAITVNPRVVQKFSQRKFEEDPLDGGRLGELVQDESTMDAADSEPGVSADSLQDQYVVPPMVQDVLEKYKQTAESLPSQEELAQPIAAIQETGESPATATVDLTQLKQQARASVAAKVQEAEPATTIPTAAGRAAPIDMEQLKAQTLAKLQADTTDQGLAVRIKINEKPLEQVVAVTREAPEIAAEEVVAVDEIAEPVTALEIELKTQEVLAAAETTPLNTAEELAQPVNTNLGMTDEADKMDEFAEPVNARLETVEVEPVAEPVSLQAEDGEMEVEVESVIAPVPEAAAEPESELDGFQAAEVVAEQAPAEAVATPVVVGQQAEPEEAAPVVAKLEAAEPEASEQLAAAMAMAEVEETLEAAADVEAGLVAARAADSQENTASAAASTVLRAKILMERERPIPALRPREGSRSGYCLKYYLVQAGEDLSAIAEKHNISKDLLRAANPVMEEDVRTGMVLSIPCQ